MLNHTYGNLLTIEAGIIAHQVNCKNVAGRGLAKAIGIRYPDWLYFYRREIHVPGDMTLFSVPGKNQKLYIASLYGQDGYGADGKLYTDYTALRNALEKLAANTLAAALPVYFPFKLGCGLAGGDWKVVLPMIREIFPNANIIIPEGVKKTPIQDKSNLSLM